MFKSLFVLANDDNDSKAQSFFTKITFHGLSEYNELSKLDIWINLSILYDISEFVRRLVYERNDLSIDLSEFPLKHTKEFIYYLHGVIQKPKYCGHWLQILDKLLIDITSYISERDIVNSIISISNTDKTLIKLYGLDEIEDFQTKFHYNKDIIVNDKYIDFYKLWIKNQDEKQSKHHLYLSLKNCQFEIAKLLKSKTSFFIHDHEVEIHTENYSFIINEFGITPKQIINLLLSKCRNNTLLDILDKNPDIIITACHIVFEDNRTFYIELNERYLKEDIREVLSRALLEKRNRIALAILKSDVKFMTYEIIDEILKYNYLHLFDVIVKHWIDNNMLSTDFKNYLIKKCKDNNCYQTLSKIRNLSLTESLLSFKKDNISCYDQIYL